MVEDALGLLIFVAVIISILPIILFFKLWGMCNDVREIKNRLFLQELDRTVEKKESIKPQPIDGSRFAVGQLVIIKSNENQFRIDSIRKSVDEFQYYSEKFNRDFTADEIEDFDEYWKIKGNK